MKALLFAGLLLASVCTFGQDRTITGTVTDATGEGIPGVTIQIQATADGTITGISGEYTLQVPVWANILIYSYVGYETQTIEIGQRTQIDIQLAESVTELAEIVVVGYGTQPKEDVTASIAQVDGEVISSTPNTSFESAIQGRAPGVFVQNNSGKLGERISVRIRGSNSLTSTNSPLYVIDGIPLTSDNQAAFNQSGNPISDLSTNDIKSIEVLKDASAAAIYGSRAANGVILITTKQGEAGKPSWDIGYQAGVSTAPSKLDLLDPRNYNIQVFEYSLRLNPLIEPVIRDEISQESLGRWFDQGFIDLEDGTIINYDIPILDSLQFNTDFQDEVFRTAISHRANASVMGEPRPSITMVGSITVRNREF